MSNQSSDWRLDTDRSIVRELISEYRALLARERDLRDSIEVAEEDLEKKTTEFAVVTNERRGIFELISRMHPAWNEHNIRKILDSPDSECGSDHGAMRATFPESKETPYGITEPVVRMPLSMARGLKNDIDTGRSGGIDDSTRQRDEELDRLIVDAETGRSDSLMYRGVNDR